MHESRAMIVSVWKENETRKGAYHAHGLPDNVDEGLIGDGEGIR